MFCHSDDGVDFVQFRLDVCLLCSSVLVLGFLKAGFIDLVLNKAPEQVKALLRISRPRTLIQFLEPLLQHLESLNQSEAG